MSRRQFLNGSRKMSRGTCSTPTRLKREKDTLRGVKDIIDRLKKLKLTQFIRRIEEIDKEAMLKDPDTAAAVEGVKIGSGGEDFVITPSKTELDEVAA